MSVIVVCGERYAAGLDWEDRNARFLRSRDYAWHVARPGQIGRAPEHGEHHARLPSLAACLVDVTPGENWVALVEGQGDRYAVVRVADGSLLADGDRVYDGRELALAAFDRAQAAHAGSFATRGLVDGAADLDLENLRPDPAFGLSASPYTQFRGRRLAALAASIAVVAVTSGLMIYADEVLDLIFPPPARPVAMIEPTVQAEIDSGALIDGCRRTLAAHPLVVPGWSLVSVTCRARFAEQAILAIEGRLRNRPVLVAQWRMATDRSGSTYREIATAHLAGWTLSQVSDAEAWAVALLPPVIRPAEGAPPPLRDWRRALDRRVGPRVSRFSFVSGSPAAEIETRRPLESVREILAGVASVEVTRIERTGTSWRLALRRVKPVTITESRLASLQRKGM